MSRLQLTLVGALLTLPLAAPAPAAADEMPTPSALPATAPTTYSKDRVIVQWAEDADHGEKVDARAEAEVTFRGDLGEPEFQLVAVEPGQSAAEAVRELNRDPAVAVAERDGYRALEAIPNDPLFGQLWGLRNLGLGINGFAGAVAGDDVDAVAAWNRTIGSPSTVVADIDSGYRFEHPDLGPVAWTNPGEIAGNGLDDDGNGLADDVHGFDFVGPNADAPSATGDNDPTDDNLISGGHGVHTAGTIGAAGNNGIGITGVARNVRIMPLRVCANSVSAGNKASCPFSSILKAINYAGNMGARVANMSLGGNSSSQTEVNAFAAHPQTLYVISAGNDSGDNDGGGAAPKGHHYPCDYTPQTQASPPVPGAIDNIVCVAATNQSDGLASFSDWGSTSVDLGAPGTETLSTYSNVYEAREDFEGGDFTSRWAATGANGGFVATSGAPLAGLGMTNSVGGPQLANTTRQSTSTAFSAPGEGRNCVALTSRQATLGNGDTFTYEILVNDVVVSTLTKSNAAASDASYLSRFLNFPDVHAGDQIKFRFTYAAGATPGAGVILDDLYISCAAPVGSAQFYDFLQGTSMAAPHVTGAAALLFSLKPTASVTEVRNALLTSVDPVASLSGKTTTGGRLDVAAALNQLVPVGAETVPPDTAILSGAEGTTASTSASFQFVRTDADAGAFECSLDGGAFAPCTSPASYTVGPGSHQFQVRAKVPSGLVDPTPATRSWSVTAPPPPPPPPPSCKVPKLAGKTLGQAKSALSAAHCTLGKVTKPKARKGRRLPPLVVKSSTPAAGATPASGKVDLKLGKKPKPKRKHH